MKMQQKYKCAKCDDTINSFDEKYSGEKIGEDQPDLCKDCFYEWLDIRKKVINGLFYKYIGREEHNNVIYEDRIDAEGNWDVYVRILKDEDAL